MIGEWLNENYWVNNTIFGLSLFAVFLAISHPRKAWSVIYAIVSFILEPWCHWPFKRPQRAPQRLTGPALYESIRELEWDIYKLMWHDVHGVFYAVPWGLEPEIWKAHEEYVEKVLELNRYQHSSAPVYFWDIQARKESRIRQDERMKKIKEYDDRHLMDTGATVEGQGLYWDTRRQMITNAEGEEFVINTQNDPPRVEYHPRWKTTSTPNGDGTWHISHKKIEDGAVDAPDAAEKWGRGRDA